MDEPLTQIVERLKRGGEAEEAVAAHFFQTARRFAQSLISSEIQGRVSATSVAGVALHNAIKAAKRSRGELRSLEFEKLLIAIVRRRVADAARAAKAQSRDVSREASVADADTHPSSDLSPAEKAVLSDIAERVTALIMEEPDEVRRLIKYLYFIDGRSTPDIVSLLAAQAKVGTQGQAAVPKRRTIERLIEAFTTQLQTVFGSGASL